MPDIPVVNESAASSRKVGNATGRRPPDVFISYRRADGGFLAQLLERALTEKNVAVFLDRHELTVGDSFPAKIRDAVKEAREFILICSRTYFGFDEQKGCRPIERPDDWCRQELALALQNDKNIFPIDLGNFFPTDQSSLPRELASVVDKEKALCPTADDIEAVVKQLLMKFSQETTRNRNRNEWENILALNPFDQTQKPSYNEAIRKLVIDRCNTETIKGSILNLIDSAKDVCTRFSAYYAAYTFYRRMGDMDNLFSLVERYRFREEFSEIPFQHVALTQYHRFKYERERNEEDLSKALEAADMALAALPDNAGVLLSYAEIIADAAAVDREGYADRIPGAVKIIEKAMKLSPRSNPKQFCIRGRLLMSQGRFEEAFRDFQRAIDQEDSEKKDAFLRIMQYQGFVYDAKLLQLEERILSRLATEGSTGPTPEKRP